MNLRSLFLVLSITCLVATTSYAQQSQTADGLRISVENPLKGVSMSTGYAPIMIRIRNLTKNDRNISVRVSSYNQSSSNLPKISLDSQETVDLELPVLLGQYGRSFQVLIKENGKYVAQFHTTQNVLGRAYGRGSRLAEISALHLTNKPGLNSSNSLDLSPPGGGRQMYKVGVTSLDSQSTPSRWQTLMGIDFILVDGEGWQNLNSEQIIALESYAEMGGCLIIFDFPGSMERELKKRIPDASRSSSAHVWHLGAGYVVAWEGQIGDGGDQDMWQTCFNRLKDAGAEGISAHSRFSPTNTSAFNEPIPGFGGVDASKFALAIILFALLVGPINFIVLHRMKRRVWALWTIPSISICAFVGLVSFSLVVEGIDTKAVPRSLIFLDQEAKTASSIECLALYANLAPGELRFDRDVAVLATLKISRHGYAMGRPLENLDVDWSDGVTLSETWVPVRTPTQINLAHSTPFRQGLDFEVGSDDIIRVTNGLDVDLDAVLYCDAEGKLWQAGRVDSAATTQTKSTTLKVKDFVNLHVAADLMNSWPRGQLTRIQKVQPNCYLAISKKHVVPCYDSTNFNVLDGVSLIYGRLEQKN